MQRNFDFIQERGSSRNSMNFRELFTRFDTFDSFCRILKTESASDKVQ